MDFRIRKYLRRFRLPCAERHRERLRRRGLGVDDVKELRVAAPREVLGVHAPDAPGAEEGEVDHATRTALPLFRDLSAASASTRACLPSCGPTGIACFFFRAVTKAASSAR